MSGRNETSETEEMDRGEHERDGFAADGGVVAATSTTTTPGGDVQQPSVNNEDHQEDSEPRTERARTEEIDVSLLRKGGVYEVQSASGNTYEVDVASKTCTCPDFTKRQPSGGCKHLRRVDIEIRSGSVPRPDGRLPATGDVTEQLSERILELEQEIDEREARRRELEATVAVLEELSIR
ncbi:hypothetical protein ACOZ32_12510 (plasmid) [Halobacterium sp. MBLA0001]|uniref:hypothetical protein n=1 Tax=Halobacterium sp. MBLA0001 TaxID=3413511 RepID=UPI003C7245B4